MTFSIEGRPPPQQAGAGDVVPLVSADYLKAMGIRSHRTPVRAGEAAPSVVVNETVARRSARGPPIGKRVRFEATTAPWFTIVGVAGDVNRVGAAMGTRSRDVSSLLAFHGAGINVVLKSAIPGELLFEPLRQAVREVDRHAGRRLDDAMSPLVGESIRQPRFFAGLVGAFASAGAAAGGRRHLRGDVVGVAQRPPRSGPGGARRHPTRRC